MIRPLPALAAPGAVAVHGPGCRRCQRRRRPAL